MRSIQRICASCDAGWSSFRQIRPYMSSCSQARASGPSVPAPILHQDAVKRPCADCCGQDGDAWRASDMEACRQKAATQLGTVGSGNHYVDLMRDQAGWVWIGVHFGNRGLGHTSATRYLKLAGGKDGMNVPPAVLDEDSELGSRYIAAMQLAGRYSYAGREWVTERVRKIIGGNITDRCTTITSTPGARTTTGAICGSFARAPAFPGQRGFVGGSMGDDAVIIEEIDSAEARASLHSTVHGAGRRFGRKEARRSFSRRNGSLAASARRDPAGCRSRREPDGLPSPAGGAYPPRRLGARASYAAAVRGRHGGGGARSRTDTPAPTGGHCGKLCRPPSWCRFFPSRAGGLPQFRCKPR
jgi:hypothetical protein